jgi:hypothetical protein
MNAPPWLEEGEKKKKMDIGKKRSPALKGISYCASITSTRTSLNVEAQKLDGIAEGFNYET